MDTAIMSDSQRALARDGTSNLLCTLVRHEDLLTRWLPFAQALLYRGRLSPRDRELVILRVAHNCGSEYEWHQHERIAQLAGLSAEQVRRVREGAEAGGWSGRQTLLLRAADELHADRELSDGLWNELRPLLADTELIELCMLVGHYEMLAMTLNTLRVQPEAR